MRGETVGHKEAKCGNNAVCAFCRNEHMTADHRCLVSSCCAVGSSCTHVRRECLLCVMSDHFTRHKKCPSAKKHFSPCAPCGSMSLSFTFCLIRCDPM